MCSVGETQLVYKILNSHDLIFMSLVIKDRVLAISLSSVGVKIRVHFVCLFRIPRCLLRVFVQLLAKLVQIASADRSIRKGAQAFQPFLAC